MNAATTVLEALSAYDTAMVPLASLVSATAMVSQALSVTAATTVPQALSANASATMPPASSANTLTSMDVDATNASIHNMMKAEEKATAKRYLLAMSQPHSNLCYVSIPHATLRVAHSHSSLCYAYITHATSRRVAA